MSTGSTKSRARNAKGGMPRSSPVSTSSAVAEVERAEPTGISPRAWLIASLGILALAAFVRLYMLELKPLHHDEGVNGFFLTNLYREGVYHYDPANYHGPTLYFFALAITKLKAFIFGEPGLSTVAVRLVPALFGTATVWLALCLRRHIGAIGALTAAALIAFSPGEVYVSRYFIHEAHFVFFTLGLVIAVLRYWETADIVYLMLASISAALVFATKETALISVAVLLLAWAVAAVYMRLVKRMEGVPWEMTQPAQRKGKARRAKPATPADALERFGGTSYVALIMGTALAIFIFVNVLFYSSFFTYWQGVEGAIESLKIWAATGTKEHGHPWYTYLQWLLQEESPLLLLGTVGAALALILRRNRFAVFAGAWAFGLLAAYSLIPYKTPWLMLNFMVPLAIIAGYGVNEIYEAGKGWLVRVSALGIASAALIVCATQAVILNFYRYDDDKYPYVYAHTYREFVPLVEKIEQMAMRDKLGKQIGVTITAPEYWPLPWYLRDYPSAGFYGRMSATYEPIVVGSVDQEEELGAALGDGYVRIDTYPLRPGVTLVLYGRKDLVEREDHIPLEPRLKNSSGE